MPKPYLMQMKDAAILAGNAAIGVRPGEAAFRVRVLSNVTVNPVKDILEFELRRGGVNAVVEVGDYNNISRNSEEQTGASAVALFWDLANLVEGFSAKAMAMDAETVRVIESRTKAELDFVLNNLRNVPLVLVNSFSSLILASNDPAPGIWDQLADSLNAHLRSTPRVNTFVVDFDKVIARVSVDKAVDWRMWLSSRLLYSTDLFKSYASFVAPICRSVAGKAKKALIFDCDNTLWKGIVGEDGLDGISISPTTKDGQPFYEIQNIALALHQQGVILGLCSKNNAEDVDHVLERHPEMVLRNEHFTIKAVNWNDKATNLREIAQKLNIGLDSIVFIDDSEFEASVVEQYLPEVEVLRVPKSLSEYPQYLRSQLGLFWVPKRTEEDRNRTAMYKEEAVRQLSKAQFASIDEHLKSLDLVLTVQENSPKSIARVAQLTQKTNQFNVTTRRYTEANIQTFVSSPDWSVFAFSLADRFGDYGLTGVAIVRLEPGTSSAEVDTLLMSCRILGRNAEVRFFDFLVERLREQGVATMMAKYVATDKNAQVSDFFDARGLELVHGDARAKCYQLDLGHYRPASVDYVELKVAQ